MRCLFKNVDIDKGNEEEKEENSKNIYVHYKMFNKELINRVDEN